MRLAYYYHCPGEERSGDVFLLGQEGRFVDALAQGCEHVTCFLPRPIPSEQHLVNYRLRSRNVELVPLDRKPPDLAASLLGPWYTRRVRARRNDFDVLLIRGPVVLQEALFRACGETPVALLLVTDLSDCPPPPAAPTWRKVLDRVLVRRFLERQKALARRCLTFVNSRVLFQELETSVPNLVEVRTTTLRASECSHRGDTCAEPPYRLLYTGRLTRTKGLPYLIDALGRLVEEGRDVVLDLLGWPDVGDDITGELRARARRRGVDERVSFLGFKSVDDGLLDVVRAADVLVMPTLGCEGFPRSVWEALANSVPVVATRVASIPHLLTHERDALLVPRRSARALARGVARILDDGELRRELIRNGYELGRTMTLEERVPPLVEALEAWSGRGPNRPTG